MVKTRKEISRKFYLKNRLKLLENEKQRRLNNSEKYKEKDRLYSKEYYNKNKEKIKERNNLYYNENKKDCLERVKIYSFNRSKKDIEYKLVRNLRSRMYRAIKKETKTGSAVNDLGISILEFKLYIEKLWKPGMTWNNWGRHGWHIDHIIPLSSFNLSNREEFLKAVHYTNLQPLWAKENLKKGSSRG